MMRKLLYKLITIAVFFTACTGSSLEPLRMAEPIQEISAPDDPLKLEPTSVLPKPVPNATPKPAFTPVSAIPHKNTECSSLALERSLILTRWDRTTAGQSLIPYDPELGTPLCNFKPIAAGKNNYVSFSPDGSLLAYSMTQHDDFRDGRLHFVDLKAWTDIPTSIEINTWIAGMAFSPDSSRLAIALGMPGADLGWPKHYSLILVDVANRALLATSTLEIATRLLNFTPDGKALMLYGVQNQDSSGLNGEAHALLLDASSLDQKWDLKLDGVVDGQARLHIPGNTEMFAWWGPAVVFSPERQVLFVVHADSERLTTVDFTQRTTTSVEIHPKMGLIERLLTLFSGVAQAKEVAGTTKQAVLSPDGARLYVVGKTTNTYMYGKDELQIESTFLGLQVIDPASGTEITHIDAEATSLAISQDGKHLFLHGWNDGLETEIRDIASLKIERHVTGRAIRPVMRLDREPLLISLTDLGVGRSVLALFDSDTLEQKAVWSVSGSAGFLMP